MNVSVWSQWVTSLFLTLSQLPEPLLTFDLYNCFIAVGKAIQTLSEREQTPDTDEIMDIVHDLQDLLQKLPSYCYSTLRHLIFHLQKWACSWVTDLSTEILHKPHRLLVLNFLLSVFTEFQRMKRTRCRRAIWASCLGQHYCALLCPQTCQCWPCWRPVIRPYLLNFSSPTTTGFLAFSKDPVRPLPQPLQHLFQTSLPTLPVPEMGKFTQNMIPPLESVQPQ